MNLYLSHSAQRQYDRLPAIEQKKIKKKLDKLLDRPTSGKKLSGEFAGFRSLRAWPYRIFYEINTEGIFISAILHRQGAYK